MSQSGSYITALKWETSDSEGPTRAEYQANWNAMDGHAHDNRGGGQGIRAIQTTNAPTQTGDICISGDSLQWWGATSGRALTAVASPAAMELISDQLLSVDSASVTFTGIPNTHKHLRLVASGRTDAAGVTTDGTRVQFNGDTAVHYAYQQFYVSNSTSVTSSLSNGATTGLLGGTTGALADAGYQGHGETVISNYAGTTFHKMAYTTFTIPTNGGAIQTGAGGSLWSSTSAIASMVLTPNTGTKFLAGSRFTLYGMN